MSCRHRSASTLLIPSIVLALASSAGAEPTQETPESPAAAPESEAAVARAEAAAPAGGTDDEWVVVNESSGLRYRVTPLPNDPSTYRWIDDKTVRFGGGVHFEVVDHDEDFLWIKEWSAAKRAPERQEPIDEETRHQIVAESYRVKVESADRLELRGFEEGLPRTGQWRNGFDVADMNEDGHLDLVFGPARKSFPPVPNIFLGDGNGRWQRWREARFPKTSYDYGDVAAGDLNGDGHQDLALSFHLLGLLVLIGDGQGEFTTWSSGIELDQPGKGTAFSSRAIELVDWNGDGRLDIFAFGEGPKRREAERKENVFGTVINTARGLLVFLNQGDGTWVSQRPSEEEAMVIDFGDSFVLGDIDQDQRLDVVMASSRIASPFIFGFGSEAGLRTGEIEPLRVRAFIGAVDLADLDGDGDHEILLGYQSHETDRVRRSGIDIYWRREEDKPGAEPSWDRRALFVEEAGWGIYAIDTGDLDGDGHRDVVALSGHGEARVFLGDGKGGFVHEVSPELPKASRGCRGYQVRLVDVDGDGGDEIIAALAGEESGLQGIPELFRPGCPGQGSLRAWKAVPVETSEASAATAGE